ncbi:hypothetical protein HJG60_008017 [Phyllostomus discolor]|uniref:Uncharacterized protein n=1 Tax=Phyllostomus discolor TaxID=89673 RepID=A0A834BL66_9CHIR|nr:hypothetical protein HJG60_008017 [Phyllostomus discolor]
MCDVHIGNQVSRGKRRGQGPCALQLTPARIVLCLLHSQSRLESLNFQQMSLGVLELTRLNSPSTPPPSHREHPQPRGLCGALTKSFPSGPPGKALSVPPPNPGSVFHSSQSHLGSYFNPKLTMTSVTNGSDRKVLFGSLTLLQVLVKPWTLTAVECIASLRHLSLTSPFLRT